MRLPIGTDSLPLLGWMAGLTRRRFIEGLAPGAAIAALSPLAARRGRAAGIIGRHRLPELSGTEFDLSVEPTPVNVTGNPRVATLVNVNATELGRWAYHCHLLYHMDAGMFTTAVVA